MEGADVPVQSDRARLESLVPRCGRRAWAVAWSLLRDPTEAEDAVQQALLVAARKPDRIPHDDPWPWFGVVVAHEARNLRRKRRPGAALHPEAAMTPRESEGGDPYAVVQSRDEQDHLARALDELPADQREAIALTHLAGMSHAMAAEALDVPRQTVTGRAKRGLETLGQSLNRKPASLHHALALLPIVPPTAGWDAAFGAWTNTALGALVSSTATSAVGGLTLMSSKTVLVLSLTAAIGVGFLGGQYASPHLFGGEPGASEAQAVLAPQDASAIGTGSPSLDSGDLPLTAEIDRLRHANATLREQMSAAELRLAEALGHASGPRTGPTFTFGDLGGLPAIHEANWAEMGQSSVIVSDSVRSILERKEAGEDVPQDVYLALQEHVERMRKYEYRTIGKMPTAAKHNGEFTHPITVANLVAAVLREAGLPLSDEQVQRISALGIDFEREFAAQRARHGVNTPRAARILEEYRLKGTFAEDLAGVLTGAQREIAYKGNTRSIAGLDLLDPTLMILHTSPVLTGDSIQEIGTKLAAMLSKKLGLDTTAQAALTRAIDSWKSEVRSLLGPVPATRVTHYTYNQGLGAAEASAHLVQRLLADLVLEDSVRQALFEDPAIYVPRVVAKAS